MSEEPMQMETKTSDSRGQRINLSLSSLYLDPNNYRFIDNEDYRPVDEVHYADDDVQRRTRRLILGQSAELVSDLVDSFRQNGWLDVETIQVRKLADRKFLVVEGNRRIATLKYIQSSWDNSTGHLGKLDSALFIKVPCITYKETDDFHHLIVMGLHHISGKRRWPAINQARLMKRLRDDYNKGRDEICRSLGVSTREFNLSIRTLTLAEAYRKSDYGDLFSSEMFNLFREILKAPSLRTWLKWNNDTEQAMDKSNLERLFSWLSREPGDDEDQENGILTNPSLDPVITTGSQIRELAKIIEDPEAVKRLEETRSLQAATLSSDLLVKNEIDGALDRCNQDVGRLFQLAQKMSVSDLDRVDELTARMDAIIVSKKRQPHRKSSERPWQVYTDIPQSHFRTVQINRYKAISGISFEELGRVNILVGINNAGKTSALEALFLLANQSDPRAVLEIIRRRTRIDPDAHPSWVINQLPNDVELAAEYDSRADNAVTVRHSIKEEPEDSDEDWASYLRTLVIESNYANRKQRSITDFFTGRTRRTRIEGDPRWLCPSVLHSPFSSSDPELLVRCNEASIRAKSKESVLQFIKARLDSGVQDIALANELSRFLVTHSNLGEAVDLSFFGEGIQRIFQIGLLFAGARGGVVLIDEFENAIHTSILGDFTNLLQHLAIDFDVQMFISTHSKETVDAFLLNGSHTDHIVSFLLKRQTDGQCSVLRFDGLSLKHAIEAGDVDIRRL